MLRTALLISCTREEASKLRSRAAYEDRGVSSYLRRVLSQAIAFDEMMMARYSRVFPVGRPPDTRSRGYRKTAVLLRCSVELAEQIRSAAARRETTISGYVLHCLNRRWELERPSMPKLFF